MDLKSMEQKRPLKTLPSGWEARLGLNGRVYYLSLCSDTVQILPPLDTWSCAYGLSYGWELAFDYEDKPYFINHVLQQVTYTDPRVDDLSESGDASRSDDDQLPNNPREYTIFRDEKLGYGFIAGSEKPVIVRSVTPGGPSINKLLPGDQIIKIEDQIVASAPRETVINLIKESKTSVTLTVIQPMVVANSSFLKPSKKLQKGMNRHRVRFSEKNDQELDANGGSLLISPNVLRVYLEEGQNRSFEFDSDTTAGDIVALLCEELGIEDNKYYSLILKSSKSNTLIREHTATKLSNDILIPPWDQISKVLNNPNIKHHTCHFRMAFAAKDVHKLSREDPNSFNYLYQQCVNDVVEGEIFRDDLSMEEIFRLASLHILLVCLQLEKNSSGSSPLSRKSSKKKAFHHSSKFSLKAIEKEFGLARFLPPHILDLVSSQGKEHKKNLQQCIKTSYNNFIVNAGGNGTNSNNKTSPPHSPSSNGGDVSLEVLLPQLRMQYVKSLSHYHLYGGRYFEATILAVTESDIILLVGHRYGISQLINNKNKMTSIFGDFSAVKLVEVAPQQPGASKTNVQIAFHEMAPLVVSMQPQAALDFANMVSGYSRVHGNSEMMLTLPNPESASAPEYFGPHQVKPSNWNYPVDADPATSFHCNFSEPLSSSMLSEHIPDSVRAMFQQSKIVEEGQDVHIRDDYRFALSDGTEQADSYVRNTQDSSDSESEQEKVRSPVDEGVAMVAVDVSLKSSTSSMMSGSPSSGIGSAGSHAGRARRIPTESFSERDQLDDSKQARTSNASSELARIAGENDDEQSCLNRDPEAAFADFRQEDEDEANVENVQDSASTFNDANISAMVDVTESGDATNQTNDFQHETLLDSGESDKSEEQVEHISEEENPVNIETENKTAKSMKSPAPPIPTQRSRFSSFKPDKASQAVESSASKSHDSSPISTHQEQALEVNSGPVLSSREFQAHLRGANVSEELPAAHLEGDAIEIVTSPLPVTDLASGHKKIKGDKKKKNRLSWGDSLPRSQSEDPETEKTKKRRSLFRGLFSTRRAYSMEKDQRKSTLSLEEEPERKKKWSFFGIFRSSSSSSKKKSRFSIFRRKTRSHDLHTSSSPYLSKGAYSVYGVSRTPEMDQVKQSASLENITMREKEVIQTKPRPVSFMTFQRPPSDEEESEEEGSPDFRRTPSVELSLNENVSQSSKDDPPALPIHVPPPIIPRSESRSSLGSENEGRDQDNYVVVGEPRQTVSNDYESLEEVVRNNDADAFHLKIKRKAPPPPLLPPSLRHQSDDETLKQPDDLYEVLDEDPLYQNAESSQTREDVQSLVIDKTESILSSSSSSLDEKSPPIPSRTSFSEDEEESNEKIFVESKEVQIVQDDFSSSFPSLKASTDDLTTQIFSVLDSRNTENQHEKEHKENVEMNFDQISSSSSSINVYEDVDVKEDLSVVMEKVTAGDVDAYLKNLNQEPASEDLDQSVDERASSKEQENYRLEPSVQQYRRQDPIPESFGYVEEALKVESTSPETDRDELEEIDREIYSSSEDNLIPETSASIEDSVVVEVSSPKEVLGMWRKYEHKTDLGLKNDVAESTLATQDEQLEMNDRFSSEEKDSRVECAPDEPKSDQLANVLNQLLINGLDEETLKESDVDGSSASHLSVHLPREDRRHYLRQTASSSSSSESCSDEEKEVDRVVEEVMTNSTNHLDEFSVNTEEKVNATPRNVEQFQGVRDIEPVEKPTTSKLPIYIPPPAEFNVPANRNSHVDNAQPWKHRANDIGKIKTSAALSPVRSFTPETSNHQSASTEVPQTSKISSDSYQHLIAPRLFGQQLQWKPFTRVKPPVSSKPSIKSVTSSVTYPGATKNGRPQLAPKHTVDHQSPS